MRLPSPLLAGRLVRRYQRFFADVVLDSGEAITAHCPNSGTMRSCALPGQRVLVSRASNPARKLPFTWEVAYAGPSGDVPVLVNTALPNGIVAEAVASGRVPELAGYTRLAREVNYGAERSRVDLLLDGGAGGPCFVEVKNVTLLEEPGVARFPDAVTERGTRHLRELMGEVARESRAVLFFLVSRPDAREVRPADSVDALYGRTLRQAAQAGVQILAYRLDFGDGAVSVGPRLPVELADVSGA